MTSAEISIVSSELINSLDEKGELPFAKRRWLQAELRQRVVSQRPDLAWLELEVISAHKIEHIWKERFPSEPTPVDLLSLADECLHSDENTEALSELLSDVQNLIEDKMGLGSEYFRAGYAGFACWSAARVVRWGVPESTSDLVLDLEDDPDLWDACYYGSLAWAGDAVEEKEIADTGSRREFWTWYANEAVPQAIAFAQHQ